MTGDNSIHVHINRLGWHFAFIGVFAMMGGAIRGYNLPLVLAGMLVGLMLMHWRLGRSTVEAISAKRRIPDEAFAGEPFKIRFLVTNRHQWLTAWLIQIEDRISRPAEVGRTSLARRLLGARLLAPKNAADETRPGTWLTTAACGVGTVPVGMTCSAEYECTIEHRGKYVLGPATVSSAMPLGLITSRKRVADTQVINVFPKLQPLRRDWRSRIQSRSGGSATTSRKSGVAEGDFFGLRSWKSGDSKRWIHWRTTARIGEPAVRQFEQQRRFDLCVLIDAYLPTATPPARSTPSKLTPARAANSGSTDDALVPPSTDSEQLGESPEMELAISTAAALISQIVPTPTNRVAVAIADSSPAIAASGGGGDQLRAMMTLLAEIHGSADPQLFATVDLLFRTVGKPQDLVVLSPRVMPAEIEQLQAMISNQCTLRWFTSADGSLDRLIERSQPRPHATVVRRELLSSTS